eukprot:bmy_13370T0
MVRSAAAGHNGQGGPCVTQTQQSQTRPNTGAGYFRPYAETSAVEGQEEEAKGALQLTCRCLNC